MITKNPGHWNKLIQKEQLENFRFIRQTILPTNNLDPELFNALETIDITFNAHSTLHEVITCFISFLKMCGYSEDNINNLINKCF